MSVLGLLSFASSCSQSFSSVFSSSLTLSPSLLSLPCLVFYFLSLLCTLPDVFDCSLPHSYKTNKQTNTLLLSPTLSSLHTLFPAQPLSLKLQSCVVISRPVWGETPSDHLLSVFWVAVIFLCRSQPVNKGSPLVRGLQYTDLWVMAIPFCSCDKSHLWEKEFLWGYDSRGLDSVRVGR